MLARALAGIVANGDVGSATWWPLGNVPPGGAWGRGLIWPLLLH